MKCVHILLLAASQTVLAQSGTGAIQGIVLDAKTQKPIPAALVTAVPVVPPPIHKTTRSAADGGFQLRNLPPGRFSLCVQAPADQYVDPCQFGGTPTVVTLTSGQSASAVPLRLAAASIVFIRVNDPQQTLNQKTKDGRRPALQLGVMGAKGIYYPAHGGSGLDNIVSYQLAIPRDTPLNLSIASRDLKLGDANGLALPANAAQQAFQHATGDLNPKSFAFTILGLQP